MANIEVNKLIEIFVDEVGKSTIGNVSDIQQNVINPYKYRLPKVIKTKSSIELIEHACEEFATWDPSKLASTVDLIFDGIPSLIAAPLAVLALPADQIRSGFSDMLDNGYKFLKEGIEEQNILKVSASFFLITFSLPILLGSEPLYLLRDILKLFLYFLTQPVFWIAKIYDRRGEWITSND